MAAPYFVDAQYGDDSTGTGSPSAPYKTLAKVLSVLTSATAETIYLSGTFYANSSTYVPQVLDMTSYSNKTVLPWSAYQAALGDAFPVGVPTQPVLCGGAQVGNLTWTGLGGTRYRATLATGKTISRLGFKYEASTTSSGHHYGVLKSNAGTATSGDFEYTSGSGQTDVNVPTAPSAAADILVSCVENTVAAMKPGNNCTVYGIHFKFWPASTAGGQFGWAVSANPGSNATISNCKAWDCGNHCFGSLGGGSCTGLTITSCTMYSCRGDGTLSVFYQENASGNLSNLQLTNCTIHMRRYLGVNGTSTTESTATADGGSTNTQIGAICHSDAGTPIQSWAANNNTIIEYEASGTLPVTANNVPTPTASTWLCSSFASITDQCRIRGGSAQTGATLWRFGAAYQAVRRSVLDFRNLGPSGLCLATSQGGISTNAGGIALFDSCAFIVDAHFAADTQATVLFQLLGAAAELRFLNCSFYFINAGAAGWAHNLFAFNSRNDVYIRARGCVFESDASWFGTHFCAQDGTTDAGHHDFLDCAYGPNIVTTMSENASFANTTDWRTNVDTSAVFLASSPYPNVGTDPTDLSLTTTSSIWAIRRATSAIVPSSTGINGARYAGNYGAYQYSSLGDGMNLAQRKSKPGRVVRVNR